VPAEVLTDRFSAPETPPTSPTHQIEAGDDPIPFGQAIHSRSEAGNLPGNLVAEDMRELGRSFADSVSYRDVESVDGASSDPE